MLKYRYIVPICYVLLYVIVERMISYHLQKGKTYARLLLIAGGLLPLLGCYLPDSPIRFALMAAGDLWMGVFLYFAGVLTFFTLVAFCRKKPHAFFIPLALAIALGTNAYGIMHARDIKVKSYELTTDKLPENLRIVLIADLHLSVNTHYATIADMVAKVNAADADLIVVAGDIFTSTYQGLKHPDKYAALLAQMKAQYGVYAVYGNHDNVEPLLCGFPMVALEKNYRPAAMDTFMQKAQMKVLNDEVVDFPDLNLTLIGRESADKTGDGDRQRKKFSAFRDEIHDERYLLVLEHEPVDYDALSDAHVNLVLSGHTHAGQFFPGTVFTKLMSKLAFGHKTFGSTDAIVTAGVGFYGPPIRVGCDADIMIIDVISAHVQSIHQNNC